MSPVILKVYANLSPVGVDMFQRLEKIAQTAIPASACSPKLAGDLFTLAFEGIYFPIEEILAEIGSNLTPEQSGKLDNLDLESWRLERYIFTSGSIVCKKAPLNNVLDYSGL